MPDLTLAQPIEGGMPGDVVNVPESRAAWYAERGYAYDPADETSKLLNTSPPRAQDPTLAENQGADEEPEPDPDPEPDPEPEGQAAEPQAMTATASKKTTTKK